MCRSDSVLGARSGIRYRFVRQDPGVPPPSERSDGPSIQATKVEADSLRGRLDELERRFEAQGMPFRKSHRPGLTPKEIQELWDLPYEVPWDVAVWFGWHDGVERGQADSGYGRFPAGQLWSLAECLEQRRMSLQVIGEPLPEGNVVFLDNWIPIFGQAQVFVLVAVEEQGVATPVEFYDMFDEPIHVQRSASISEFVDQCHRMLDDKLWVWDPFEREWEYHYDEIPADRKWLAGL